MTKNTNDSATLIPMKDKKGGYLGRHKLRDIIAGKSLSTQKYLLAELTDMVKGPNVRAFHKLAKKMGVRITRINIKK
jgi:hypothetical protein